MPATTNPEIHHLALGDEGILFHEPTQRLWTLNPVLDFIWRQLQSGTTRQQLIEALINRYGIDTDLARRDLKNTLEQLQTQGLLKGGTPAPGHQQPAPQFDTTGPGLNHPTPWAATRSLQLHNLVVRFDFDNPTFANTFTELFDNLLIEPHPKPDHQIALTGTGDNHALYLDNRQLIGQLTANRLMPWLLGTLFHISLQSLSDQGYLLFHAAVLEKNGEALLLAGNSGSGKSTQATLMASRGWNLWSDELAIIDPENLQILPHPMPVSLKSGSWPILDEAIPELSQQPEYLRDDGKRIRYLPLATATHAQASIRRITRPEYSAPGEQAAAPESPTQKLALLCRAGSSARPLKI